jgi:hypothetical protein
MSNQIFVHPYPFCGREYLQMSSVLNGSIQLYGSYPSGGEPLNWNNLVSAFGINEVNPLGMGKSFANGSANVTALSASTGTITATAANNFIVGQTVKFVGCTTTLGLLLNGQTFTVVTASATAFTFLSAATGSGSSETGIVVSQGSPILNIASPPPLSLVATVTTFSASGGIITATSANNFLPGAQVTFANCVSTLGLLLNGLTFTVLSSTGTAFTFASALTGTGTSESGNARGRNAAQPYDVDFWSCSGNGYTYSYNASLGALHVQQGAAAISSPNADISAGTYNSTLLADCVRFQAYFQRG